MRISESRLPHSRGAHSCPPITRGVASLYGSSCTPSSPSAYNREGHDMRFDRSYGLGETTRTKGGDGGRHLGTWPLTRTSSYCEIRVYYFPFYLFCEVIVYYNQKTVNFCMCVSKIYIKNKLQYNVCI